MGLVTTIRDVYEANLRRLREELSRPEPKRPEDIKSRENLIAALTYIVKQMKERYSL